MKNSTSPLSPEAIASRAYQLWEAAGRPEGRDQDYWLLAEQDRMINPETQAFMAQRMKATLRRLDVDHTPIATAPDRVIELLREAGRSITA